MHIRSLAILGALVILTGQPAFGQDIIEKLDELSLEELLNIKVSVVTKKQVSSREAPGIVTVITGEEIAKSGARDLIDVLRLVPGFEFGLDVQGVVGIGTRGLWGHEGKVLLIIDGLEYNEPMFNSLQFGNHFAVEHIKRIEIIRGPGSVIYGGYAELAVINIITDSPADIGGFKASGVYGLTAHSFNRRNLNMAFGRQQETWGIKVLGFIGQGNRSDRQYRDFYGHEYDMDGNSDLNPANLSLALNYRYWQLQLTYDNYRTTSRDLYDESQDAAYQENFKTYFGELKYDRPLSQKWTLNGKINYKRQNPWFSHTPAGKAIEAYYDNTVQRYGESLTLTHEASDQLSLLIGQEIYHDRTNIYDLTAEDIYTVPKLPVNYTNLAFLGQALLKLRYVNAATGFRFDAHNQYGNSFVPRFSVTRATDLYHFKLIYSEAFRAPGIENIHLNEAIKSERTHVFEIESGLHLSAKWFMSLNLFNIKITDPIVYYYDEVTEGDAYLNFARTGSYGLEAEARVKLKHVSGMMTYSFYHPYQNKVDLYETGHDGYLLAFPAHKITGAAHIRLPGALTLNPSFVWYGKRYGYTDVDDEGTQLIKPVSSELLANLYLAYQRNRFTLGVGVFDLLQSNYEFIQPYDGYHAPLPGPSREFLLKLGYDLKK